jgi:hypothetical protein
MSSTATAAAAPSGFAEVAARVENSRKRQLVRFIEAHDQRAWIADDGRLLAIDEHWNSQTGERFTETVELTPTVPAVKRWLGY